MLGVKKNRLLIMHAGKKSIILNHTKIVSSKFMQTTKPTFYPVRQKNKHADGQTRRLVETAALFKRPTSELGRLVERVPDRRGRIPSRPALVFFSPF